MQGGNHLPVLVDQVLAYLAAERPGLYLDCTLGLGGHSLAILKHNPQAQIIGFDIDESSLLEAQKKLMPYAERVELIHSDFRYIPDLKLDFPRIKGVLLDLGLSSFQLDNPARGFSYQLEGPLDMRMDTRNKLTAWKIIHKYSEKQLADIFWKFGQLRQSKKLARAIVSRRKRIKLETTRDLLR
ncbi:MAG TPA: 16S rRNA (cytosine(1402)-N(4))-methyltransferase, partial [Candidatus Aminicenantes bacterium]|nr:16S rRNA (cytosine(1402)-N(4))-methyltransferase [Candidatus Aminicenantes bacterium]